MIIASATDIASGTRFLFHRTLFDLICSDLDVVRLSRAAAASSAVPVVLSPVTFNNYGGTCGFALPGWLKPFVDSANPPRPAARTIASIKEAEQAFGNGRDRPYLHLVDGGVADNVAMRGVLDALDRASKPSTRPVCPRISSTRVESSYSSSIPFRRRRRTGTRRRTRPALSIFC